MKATFASMFVTLALAAGLLAAPQDRALADHGPGLCHSDPYPVDSRTNHTEGKLRIIYVKCSAGPGRPALMVGTVSVVLRWSHRVDVEVCDGFADGIGVRGHFTWDDGTVWSYSDYGGAGDGCRTHRLDYNDTPSKWKTVVYDDDFLQWWRVSWGSSSWTYEWPLHAF